MKVKRLSSGYNIRLTNSEYLALQHMVRGAQLLCEEKSDAARQFKNDISGNISRGWGSFTWGLPDVDLPEVSDEEKARRAKKAGAFARGGRLSA